MKSLVFEPFLSASSESISWVQFARCMHPLHEQVPPQLVSSQAMTTDTACLHHPFSMSLDMFSSGSQPASRQFPAVAEEFPARYADRVASQGEVFSKCPTLRQPAAETKRIRVPPVATTKPTKLG